MDERWLSIMRNVVINCEIGTVKILVMVMLI